MADQSKQDDDDDDDDAVSSNEVSIYGITSSIISEDYCISNCIIDNNTGATNTLDAITD